jgi:glutamine synthetase
MSSWSEIAEQKGIRYFLIAFVDLFGSMRSKLVPASAMDRVAKSGAGFAGFATWFDMTPADPDVLVIPEMESLIQLPWKPEVAWVTGDLVMGGKPVQQNPRQVLKRLIAEAAKSGYEIKTGVECEYFLITPDGQSISDESDKQAKPCYDQQALMRRYDIVAEICDAMILLGWKPYQNDHEDGNGQFEMNWDFDSALKTADKHAFFKFMVKSIAEKHGLRATFMPKPFSNLTGSGCHVHASLWSSKDGTCIFQDSADELGLSKVAYHFIGGVIHSKASAPSPTRW